MFQIPEFTEAKIASVTPRVEKHGDDDKPAVSIKLEIEAANTLLDAIDPSIRHALYTAKPDAEPELQAEAAAGASKLTARGREATRKALAEGAAAHAAAGAS